MLRAPPASRPSPLAARSSAGFLSDSTKLKCKATWARASAQGTHLSRLLYFGGRSLFRRRLPPERYAASDANAKDIKPPLREIGQVGIKQRPDNVLHDDGKPNPFGKPRATKQQ